MFLFAAADTLQGAAGTASAITVSVWGVNVTVSTGAEVFGLLYQGQLPASAGVLFTVPAGQASIVKSINITNSTGSSVTGIQLFQNGAVAANSLIGPITMAGHFTLTGSENGWAMTDSAGVLQTSGGGGGGGGTVTSVGLSAPTEFTVGGSPVTTTGTLTFTKNAQAQNSVYAGPSSGGSGVPAFRGLATSDLPAGTAGLLNTRILTSGTTYTPTTGTNSIVVFLSGAGGGAGGCAASASGSQIGLAFPGQAGGWLQVRLTSAFSGATYAIGALGPGGAAGTNPGTDGGDTTFTTTTPVTYTAKGGKGGIATPGAFGPVWLLASPAGNATSGGDISFSGSLGSLAIAGAAGNATSGTGGAGPYSAGGRGAALSGSGSQSIVGGNADGKGGGGGGSISTNGGAAAAGGNGSAGVIIIYEYS